MRIRFALVLAGVLATGMRATATNLPPVVALDGSSARLPAAAVVMVWATWCAPCRKELATFRTLAPAAQPMTAVTLALDPPHRAAAALTETGATLANAFATDAPPQAVLAYFGGEPARLPLVFALDGHGRICGVRHGLLGSDQLKAWATSCR